MKTGELLKLITLGYKAADLKELNELSKEKPEALQIALSGSNLSDTKDYLSLISDEEGTKPEPEVKEPPESVTEPDYKSMYEELKKKSDEQEEQIKQIQNQNQRQDQSGNKPTDEDILKDIVSSFM